MPPLRWDNDAMTAAEEPTSHDGFEISVDEAAYLVEYLDLIGLLPEVLAVYNPMTSAELVDGWKAHQHQRLTERGILTSTGALPEVAEQMRTLAHSQETLAIRITPLQQADTMLRLAIATRYDRFVVASRTRDIFLVQSVPVNAWQDAVRMTLDTNLGTAEPAPLSHTLQLSVADVNKIGAASAGEVADLLTEMGIHPRDAAVLNAASTPTVATEITAARRVDGIVRRSATAVTILDTTHGRVMAWPHIGPDRSTWISYAAGEPHRLQTAIAGLLEQFDSE